MLYIIILLLILVFLFKSNENFSNSSGIISESINDYSSCYLINDEEIKGKIVTFELGNGQIKTTCDFGEPVNNTCSTMSTKCANQNDCSEYIKLETTINGDKRCRKYPYDEPFI